MSTSKLKQTSMDDFFSQYNIASSGWISSNSKSSPKSVSRTRVRRRKNTSLKSPKSNEDNTAATKEETKKIISDDELESFKQYGIVTPSLEDVKLQREELERDKLTCKKYEALLAEDVDELPTFSKRKRSTSPLQTDMLLDCKSLSNSKLKEYFEGNIDYLFDICKERIHFERHETYKNERMRQRLIINYSTLVFTHKQTEYLLQLLDDKFQHDVNGAQYLLMVLLPELCLQIFMKMHDMNEKEATKYLVWRPAE